MVVLCKSRQRSTNRTERSSYSKEQVYCVMCCRVLTINGLLPKHFLPDGAHLGSLVRINAVEVRV